VDPAGVEAILQEGRAPAVQPPAVAPTGASLPPLLERLVRANAARPSAAELRPRLTLGEAAEYSGLPRCWLLAQARAGSAIALKCRERCAGFVAVFPQGARFGAARCMTRDVLLRLYVEYGGSEADGAEAVWREFRLEPEDRRQIVSLALRVLRSPTSAVVLAVLRVAPSAARFA
jgi:hypothetical protein